jgi:hypothetical protein
VIKRERTAERDGQFWFLSTSLTIVVTGTVMGSWEKWSRNRTDFESLPNPLIAFILFIVADSTALLFIRRRRITPGLAVVHGIAVAGVLLSTVPAIDLIVGAG